MSDSAGPLPFTTVEAEFQSFLAKTVSPHNLKQVSTDDIKLSRKFFFAGAMFGLYLESKRGKDGPKAMRQIARWMIENLPK